MDKCPALECFYAILGVKKDSSRAEIRTAYRKLAMKWHPDKCANSKDDAREQAKLKFQAVQEAYAVLSDGNKRLLYDAGLLDQVEQDSSMQEFVGELVNLMNGGVGKPTKSSQASPTLNHQCVNRMNQSNSDSELEELSKLFASIVDADNYVRDIQQFDFSRKPAVDTSANTLKPGQFQDTKLPPPDIRPQESQQFYFSTSVDSIGKTRDTEQPLEGVPQPHANLYRFQEYDQFDYGSDYFDDSSDYDSEFLSYEHGDPAPTPPIPHANLYLEDSRYFDFSPLTSTQSTSTFEEILPSISPSISPLPANMFMCDTHELNPPCMAFESVRLSSGTPPVSETNSRAHAQVSETNSGPHVMANSFTEGFCMGVSGPSPGSRGYRRSVNNAKVRKNRCRDKAAASPPCF